MIRNNRKLWKKYSKLFQSCNGISFVSGVPNLEESKRYFEKVLEAAQDGEGTSLGNKSGLVLTNGAQQGLNLIASCLVKPGDSLLVETVSYIGIEEVVEGRGVRIIGINLENLEAAVKKYKPRLLYLVSDFSNPKGESISVKNRKLIARLADKYDFWVIDDQTYRDLFFDRKNLLPALKKYSKKVITVGTISKLAFPFLPVGWIFSEDKMFVKKLKQLMSEYRIQVPEFNQRVAAKVIDDLEKGGRVYNYSGKMRRLLSCLKKMMPGGYVWTEPEGGVYVWVEGPKDFNSEESLKLAVENGVTYMPGKVFCYEGTVENTFRLAIGDVDEADIKEGIKRLAATLRGETVRHKKILDFVKKIVKI